jgi:hypothetical protein
MRKLLEHRIFEIREIEHNFPKDTIRWKTFIVFDRKNGKDVHISDLDIETLEDKDLMDLYERIVRRRAVQM